jgi:hypothetical protein
MRVCSSENIKTKYAADVFTRPHFPPIPEPRTDGSRARRGEVYVRKLGGWS